MTFTLKIKLGNAAMQTEQDISDALQELVNEGSITTGRGDAYFCKMVDATDRSTWMQP